MVNDENQDAQIRGENEPFGTFSSEMFIPNRFSVDYVLDF